MPLKIIQAETVDQIMDLFTEWENEMIAQYAGAARNFALLKPGQQLPPPSLSNLQLIQGWIPLILNKAEPDAPDAPETVEGWTLCFVHT